MVWLGVDLGNARVGLALSDPELTMAYPAGNVQVWGDYFQALDDVLNVIEDNHVDTVAIGLPLLMNGDEGASAQKARSWMAQLRIRLRDELADPLSGITWPVDVMLVDERLTTVDAHRKLSDANINGRKHRPMVDQQSAVEILDAALRTRA